MTTRLPDDLVIATLREPARLTTHSLATWDRLIQQARRSDLLARLADIAVARGEIDRIPAAPRAHLLAARLLSKAQHDEVRREVEHVRQALVSLATPIVLLKGAAYLMSDAVAASGRLFSDVDILVPKARIADVEAQLMLHGWATTKQSEYDQRYYREWMHELPPMEHQQRGTVLDVHHAILPETARVTPDVQRLLASAQPIEGHPGLYTLAPTDLVLHSMTHLVFNDDMSHGLRDLSDLDLLLRHHGADAAFWPGLVERARELGLSRVLHYGLRYTHALLGTPVPPATGLAAAVAGAPRWPVSGWMDAIWRRALRTPHPATSDLFTPVALFALYVRGHWLRMPLPLLLRHLTIKALRPKRDDRPEAA